MIDMRKEMILWKIGYYVTAPIIEIRWFIIDILEKIKR